MADDSTIGQDERPEDARFMARALEIGRRGDPSPNPHVGCLVVRDGKVVSEAHHDGDVPVHPEVAALQAAGDGARGATLYVTLEPCNHHGKTPPCTAAIVAAGVSRVVVGCSDPNPHVTGGGVTKLRAAGLDVTVGVQRARAEALIRPWTKYITRGCAYLSLKLASSLDGRIASKTGASKWITSEASRERAHRLRAAHDAVLVGVSTVVNDDPELTVRHGPPAPNPIRIIVDSSLRIPVSSKIVASAGEIPTCVVTTTSSSPKAGEALVERGVNVMRVQANAQGRCNMKAVLEALAEREVVSVLCEGGAELAGSLLANQLADELHFFVAPLLLGPRGRPCAMDWAGPEDPATAPHVEAPQWERCGPDMYLSGQLAYPTKAIESR